MAKNNCTSQHSVHVFAIGKNDWENKIVKKWSMGESFECEDLDEVDDEEYLLCTVHLKPNEASGFAMAPGARGVFVQQYHVYFRKPRA